MSIVIEKAMPPDAKALLDYLKQVGGETEISPLVQRDFRWIKKRRLGIWHR